MEIQNKYDNGKIYQIADIGYNKCYIRSTTEGLIKFTNDKTQSKLQTFLK